jgi:hypothetical protein
MTETLLPDLPYVPEYQRVAIQQTADPEKVAIWAEALRSGRFTQGKQHLTRRFPMMTTYCCVGVACEIAGLQSEADRQRDATTLAVATFLRYGRYRVSDLAPRELLEWLGFDLPAPHVHKARLYLAGGYHNDLVELNDVHDWSFESIAAAIEKYGVGINYSKPSI